METEKDCYCHYGKIVFNETDLNNATLNFILKTLVGDNHNKKYEGRVYDGGVYIHISEANNINKGQIYLGKPDTMKKTCAPDFECYINIIKNERSWSGFNLELSIKN